jgi:hypothetical protein
VLRLLALALNWRACIAEGFPSGEDSTAKDSTALKTVAARTMFFNILVLKVIFS